MAPHTRRPSQLPLCLLLGLLASTALACRRPAPSTSATQAPSSKEQTGPLRHSHDHEGSVNVSGTLALHGFPGSLIIDDGSKPLSTMTFSAAPGEFRYVGPGGRVVTVEEVEVIKFYDQVLVVRTATEVVLVPVGAFIDASGPDNVPDEPAAKP